MWSVVVSGVYAVVSGVFPGVSALRSVVVNNVVRKNYHSDILVNVRGVVTWS